MYCPECHSEYRNGIEECADCKVPLVHKLMDDSQEENDRNVELQYMDLVTVLVGNASIIAIAKSLLTDAKIYYFAKGEHVFVPGYSRSVQMQVRKQDEDEAKKLLEELRTKDTSEFSTCLECDSKNIYYKQKYFFFKIFVVSKKWICRDCGYSWISDYI